MCRRPRTGPGLVFFKAFPVAEFTKKEFKHKDGGILLRAVVLAQLVERPLPIPKVGILNPVIGKNIYIEHLFSVNCIEKDKNKGKEAWNGLPNKRSRHFLW